ncbi:MAG: alpha/beta hydrolase [Clostridia bacterium]|nr:alpha/beta hydrolase [Clostridia bacterium]
MEQITIPVNRGEQTLTFKVTPVKALTMIFQPPIVSGDKPAPVYLIITGGGWHEGSAESMLGFSAQSCLYARSKGWAVASITYRFNVDGADMDQIVSDCMDACRYLARFSKELGVDATRILTSGHSAGGHLALMLALAPHDLFKKESPYEEDFRVIATAPLSPPTVLYENGVPVTLKFSMKELFPKMSEEDFKRTSPVTYVNAESVPCLSVAGDMDNLVYPVSSAILMDRYHECGAPGELVYSHKGGHCFECMVPGDKSEPDFAAVQTILERFIDRFTQ